MPGYTLRLYYLGTEKPIGRALEALHKVLSPKTYACSLCKLTHGSLQMHGALKNFAQEFNIKLEVIHLEEALNRYHLSLDELPQLELKSHSSLVLKLTKDKIEKLSSLEELLVKLREQMV